MRAPSQRLSDSASWSCHPPGYRLVSFYAVQPAELANQRIGPDRQDEQNDQQRIHPRHVENTVGLDDQETDAFVRELGFREQSTDQREAETKAYAVDHWVPHRRQINLQNHLPGTGAKAPADANRHFVYLSHAGRDIECHRKETGQRAKRYLGFRPNPEPHNHNREEDDLRCWTQVVEVRL